MTSTPSSGEAGASDANEAVLPTASPESDRYFDHAGALVADDLHPFGERATTLLLSALAPRRGQRLLELGCGTGKALARLGRNDGLDLVGIDRSLEMLRTARVRMRWSRLRSRPRLLRADARRLPFPDGAFEGVYAESVLAFQSEPGVSAVVREARRVLRGGGLLVLNEAIWRPGTREEDAARAHATAAAVFGLFQTGGRAIAIDGWRQRFEGAGFEVLEDPPLEQLTAAVQATPSGVPLVARFALAARRILRVRRPAVRRSLRRYRRAEDEIRQVGAAIEARLFVLRRAEDRSA